MITASVSAFTLFSNEFLNLRLSGSESDIFTGMLTSVSSLKNTSISRLSNSCKTKPSLVSILNASI